MARRFQSSPLNILYEDDQIIVCVKPHGIATQSRSVAVPDMERLIKNHLCAPPREMPPPPAKSPIWL